jgi:membrane protein YfhO
MSAIVYLASAVVTLMIAQRVRCFSPAAALALLLLPLLFTGRALLTGGVFGPVDLAYTSEPMASTAPAAEVGAVKNPSISDVYAQFMPWNDALRRSLARHQWPLWNPYELCGAPLAGSAQSSPYHPITLIGFLVPMHQSFAFAASMMLFLAATGAFLFFREFVESEVAALFGAAAWMCSTHLVFFAGTALVLASSATPLVLLGARRIVRDPGPRSVTILATALLLVVLAGHPESALHIVSFAVAYFAFQIFPWRTGNPACPDRRDRLSSIFISGLASGLIALLLSAIFLLPIFEAIPQSQEYVHRELGYRQTASTVAQMIHRLTANFFPFLEGAPGLEEPIHPAAVGHGWLATSYAGSMLFAPAVFAVARSRSRERWFFLGAIVWGLAVGIGAPGITHLLSHLPGFAIAVNDRMIAFAALGLCALAALGIDAWDPKLAKTFALVAGVILIAGIAATSGVSVDFLRVGTAREVLPVALASCAIAILPRRNAEVALLALLLIQRGGEASSLQPTLPSQAFYPPFAGVSIMRSNEPFRILAIDTMLPPEISTHYGLEDVRGFQGLTFNRLWDTYPMWCVTQPVWSNRVDRLDSPLLSLMNARFAIAPPSMALPPWWRIRAAYPTYSIVENTRVLPRAFVPKSVSVVAGAQDSLRALPSIADFAAWSVVEDKIVGSEPNGPGVAQITSSGSHLRVRAQMSGPGWVVVSNSFWKGWTAWERGRRVPLRFADHAFMAMYLPRGNHEIELRYRPRSFVIGAWVSGLTALLILAYVAIPSSAITFFMSFQTSFFAAGVRRRYAG